MILQRIKKILLIIGVILTVIGALLFFFPEEPSKIDIRGLIIFLIGPVFALAGSPVSAYTINPKKQINFRFLKAKKMKLSALFSKIVGNVTHVESSISAKKILLEFKTKNKHLFFEKYEGKRIIVTGYVLHIGTSYRNGKDIHIRSYEDLHDRASSICLFLGQNYNTDLIDSIIHAGKIQNVDMSNVTNTLFAYLRIMKYQYPDYEGTVSDDFIACLDTNIHDLVDIESYSRVTISGKVVRNSNGKNFILRDCLLYNIQTLPNYS